MSSSRIEYLLAQYQRGAATPGEEEELMALLAEPSNRQAAEAWIDQVLAGEDTGQHMPPEHAGHILEAIFQTGEQQRYPTATRRIPRAVRWVAAAAIAGIAALGTYLLVKQDVPRKTTAAYTADIPPGKSQAVLVLADGGTVTLDSAGSRTLQQGNAAVMQANGQLQYTAQDGAEDRPAYNELKTPRGGHFRLQLSDGTTVWMNAGSSLKYPTAFSGNERVVELSGEAYFEVAKNAASPFQVMAGGIKILVLGTHFNIKAYTDEQTVSTTLLQGAVKVTGRKGSSTLRPGEQAQVDADGALSVTRVNTTDVMAWKNGLFVFKTANVQTVMRELSRWYDIDVVYEGEPTAREFSGKISRNYTLQEVLSVLEASKVHFRLDGKKLTVLP
ncbi:iron dicitrate transport regulator FecR [Chitinophaga alhagiae]|uniref:Iron dicitrate transport regulator FecR n=1 Tax=Chitinophaga alhagiae TaxID=2203219 RepID=A0ABM6W9F3_9BACT|nr:FecR family protein [Chitinophaga alhagiae]AWO00564.1 iron dicitrate transport regulator FecR [Chitinophaga alhagiae]